MYLSENEIRATVLAEIRDIVKNDKMQDFKEKVSRIDSIITFYDDLTTEDKKAGEQLNEVLRKDA